MEIHTGEELVASIPTGPLHVALHRIWTVRIGEKVFFRLDGDSATSTSTAGTSGLKSETSASLPLAGHVALRAGLVVEIAASVPLLAVADPSQRQAHLLVHDLISSQAVNTGQQKID